MAASITDKFNESTTNARPVAATTTAIKTIGATTLTVDSLADWPTDTAVHFTMFEIDANNKEVANTRTDWKAIKTSATTLGTLTLQAGTDREYPIGSKVICAPTAAWADDLVEGLLVSHDQDGTLKADAVDVTAVIKDSIITPAKLDSTFKQGWFSGELPAVSSVTHNGNRSYDITFASTVAATLSEGMRIRTTRTVAAPTQCADLEAGSSQYFSVTNATGLATGTTWTFKAKIKPESYTAGIIAAIDDGTNKVQIYMESDGRITVNGGATGALDAVTSYQSVVLGKWQDVTGSITIGTPTGEIRIDDTVVPSSVTASAATTMTINGDEEIYIGRNAGGSYFDGKICQVAIFNAIISDATLKTYSSQTMTGSETNCEGFWSLNNTLADLSANGNTLVAGGGAVATDTDSPFGNRGTSSTLDYALVMDVDGTDVTLQVPEGCTIPTSGGVSAVAYSTQANPYGWVSDKGRWEISSLNIASQSITLSLANQWYISNLKLTVPTGKYVISSQLHASRSTTVAAAMRGNFCVEAATPTNSVRTQKLFGTFYTGASCSSYHASLYMEDSFSIDTPTAYSAYGDTTTTSGTESWALGTGVSFIKAIPSNL